MIKVYEGLKAENERLALANEAQNETIQRLQDKCRKQEMLLQSVANFLDGCEELRGKIIGNVHEEQSIDRWISVKDRLPENDCLYIVCKTVKGHWISFEARWKGNKWLSVVNNNQLDYVTHWQPLPEPPKEV